MWGQAWDNMLDLFTPYPDVKSENITKSLIEKGFTTQKMFEVTWRKEYILNKVIIWL